MINIFLTTLKQQFAHTFLELKIKFNFTRGFGIHRILKFSELQCRHQCFYVVRIKISNTTIVTLKIELRTRPNYFYMTPYSLFHGCLTFLLRYYNAVIIMQSAHSLTTPTTLFLHLKFEFARGFGFTVSLCLADS